MQTASRLNLVTGEINEYIQAPDHRRELEAAAAPGASDNDNYRFFVPHDGEPLEFTQGKANTSYFRRTSGYGLQNPDKGRLRNVAERAFKDKEGPKHLLILDDSAGDKRVFSYHGRDYDLSKLHSFNEASATQGLWPLEQWILGNKGQFVATVAHNIQETTRAIRDAKTLMTGQEGRSLSSHFYVAYRGVVTDFSHFFYDRTPPVPFIKNLTRAQREFVQQERERLNGVRARQDERRIALYHALHENKVGITVRSREDDPKIKTPDRVVGMPVLMRLHASDTTIKQHGAKGLKCNMSEDGDQGNSLVLLNTEPRGMRETVAFQSLRKRLLDGNDVLVLASPSVEFDAKRQAVEKPTDGNLVWRALNMVINDVERQTRDVERPAPLFPGR